jgi:hypothetical protein
MFKFIILILRFLLRNISDEELKFKNALLEKENSILLRRLKFQKKRVRFSR